MGDGVENTSTHPPDPVLIYVPERKALEIYQKAHPYASVRGVEDGSFVRTASCKRGTETASLLKPNPTMNETIGSQKRQNKAGLNKTKKIHK